MQHEFLANWDDSYYVTDNEVVRGFTIPHLLAAFNRFYVGNYAPVQIISYMLDYNLWGMTAGGFILTNLALHALNGLLLYALVFRLHASRWIAASAACIFLFHPVQVESAVWISQRKNLLAMAFFLAAVHLYLRYREGGSKRRGYYAASLLTFILALLTKSVAVILPLVLVAHDACFPDANGRRIRLRDKIPYALAALAVGILAWISQDPTWGSGGGRVRFHGGTPLTNLFTALPILPRYLFLLVRPDRLSVMYPATVKTALDGEVALGALLVIVVVSAALVLYRRNKSLCFWFSLFFIGFLPVSQVIPLVTLMNDRYFYFPMLGLAGLLPLLADKLLQRMRNRWRTPVAICLALTLLPLPYFAARRCWVWSDAITLWSDAAAKFPDHRVIRTNLVQALTMKGEEYRKASDFNAALRYYQRALELDPTDKFALNNIGFALMQRGDYPEARRYFLDLTARYPGDFNGYLNLGFTCNFMGDLKGAEEAYRSALTIRPDAVVALKGLADLYVRQNRKDLAAPLYRKAEAIEKGGKQ